MQILYRWKVYWIRIPADKTVSKSVQ